MGFISTFLEVKYAIKKAVKLGKLNELHFCFSETRYNLVAFAVTPL